MLTPSERTQLELLAETALPAGRILPGATAATVRRLETFLGELPPAALAGYRKLIFSLDAQALLQTRTRFSKLPFGRRVEVLDALENGEATRLLLRGLLAPLKVAHFDDPAVYAALGCRFAVDPPLTKERNRWQEQVLDAATLPEGEPLECDVVVVGTGAGGAPMAKALAERGHAVLLVEEGPYFTRKDFTGRPVQMMKQMYRQGGATVAFGNTAIPVPIGRGVGGTTLINSGTCFRLPREVLASWRAEGLRDFTDDALTPFYEEVEDVIGVGPSTAAALGAPARIIARGCDALGYSHHALMRNAPGCDGQGLCCFGCPTEAKRSTNVSYVPLALDKGAQLITGLRIERVLTERDAAVGVSGVATADGRKLTVRAKVVVLACGTLNTPALLERSGLCGTSGQLGRNLSIHPASAGLGVFDEEVNASRTVPQGYAIDEFKHEGLYFEGGQVPLELTAATLSGSGPSFVSLMEQFNQSFTFGFMVKDTSRGRVSASASGEPSMRYSVNEHDRALLQRGFAILSRVYFAAGAKEVRLPVLGFDRLRNLDDVAKLERAKVPARHMDLTAYHPLGTARMGVAPLNSVVDETNEAHDVHSLFIADGSAVPSSLGVNPQLTLMAMSLRAAGFVHRRLERLQRA
ncbi:MAG: GMC family oxidoreductase [Archangium sp.]|nr:GMC family oxidoreductase [Archangium sp.]